MPCKIESGLSGRGFVFFILVVATLLQAGSAFSADVKIVLPCGRTPFPECAAQRVRLLDGNYSVAKQPQPGFRTMVLELINGIYDGKVDPLGAENAGGIRGAVELVGKPPICLALPISEHQCKDEYVKNYRDETCPLISRVGQVNPNQYFYGLGRAASGSLESAVIAGGLVLGLSNQAKEIEKSIIANDLTISTSSGCNARAVLLQKALADQTSVKLLERVAASDVTGTGTGSTKKYFDSGYSVIQATYLYLAKCRLIEEAANKARKFSLAYVSKIENEVLKVCQGRFPGYPAQLKSCYANEFNSWITKRAQVEFPLLTACTPSTYRVPIPALPTELGDSGTDEEVQ